MNIKVNRKERKIKVTYLKMVYLFILGSLGGFLLEGVFSYFKRGAWESHVVSVWGPFCIIYGIGLCLCYMGYVAMDGRKIGYKFFAFGLGGCLLELIAGALLDTKFHMRAWNYTKHPFNFRGYVSLDMIVVWGILGVLMAWAVPNMDKIFSKLDGRFWEIFCKVFIIFMALNLTITTCAINRWSERHFDLPPSNFIEEKLDEVYPDDYMHERFCEWKFIE